MSATTERAHRTYGNWFAVRSPGLGNAGIIGTIIIISGLLLLMFALMIGGIQAGLIVAVLVGAAYGVVGTPFGKWVANHIVYERQVNRREHQWRSGVFSRNKMPNMRLPGMLGKMTLLGKADPFGNEFAVIKNPRKGGLYTVVAKCIAEGPSLQDQHKIDVWVANWGMVLASTASEPALVCAKAITDTAPDPGGRLGALVTSARVPNSPGIAQQVMDECVRTYPSASSENVTYVELVFRGQDLHKKGDETAILTELARKVPSILGQIQVAGGGSVEMVTPDELPKIVRAAYDPAAASFIEAAELAGLPAEASQVPWSEAGPVADQAFWDHYVHDSGRSITWEMTAPPRAAITEMAAAGLLRPHRNFVRKRVALLYRPHSPEDSTKQSEKDANTATFNAKQSKKKITATAEAVMRAAELARQEVAYGAALVRFSVMVTATVTTTEDLDQAAATIESQAGSIPMRMRRCYGSQGAAFATTLPIGFVPWEHTIVSTKVRELM